MSHILKREVKNASLFWPSLIVRWQLSRAMFPTHGYAGVHCSEKTWRMGESYQGPEPRGLRTLGKEESLFPRLKEGRGGLQEYHA